MFGLLKKWFPEKQETTTPSLPKAPEAMGLALGGSFTIDPLLLKTMEPSLIIEGASSTQVIQAVGIVKIDEQNRLLRFYTDDEGFLQILQYGEQDTGISEISLWYFYDATAIPKTDWDKTLKEKVVTPNGQYELEEQIFQQFWPDSAPVPAIEKTYHLDGTISETAQFMMAYNRELEEKETFEMLVISAEEKVNHQFGTVEHELVRSTGFNLSKIDITSN